MTKNGTRKIFSLLESFEGFFAQKRQYLEKNDVLFSPGENPYFYIVTSWSLNVFRITPLGEKREIGRVYAGAFLGEWVIFDRNTKDTEAIACTKNTSVIPLTKSDLEAFGSMYPEKTIELYRHFVEVTSTRLNETGKELALIYEMGEQINYLGNTGSSTLKQIINYIAETLDVDYITYIEKHPLVHDLLVYKYSSKFPSVRPINQIVDREFSIRTPEGYLTSTENIIGASDSDSLYLLPLKTNDQPKGLLLIGMKHRMDISDPDLRILRNLSPLLASIIENQQSQSEKTSSARAEISF